MGPAARPIAWNERNRNSSSEAPARREKSREAVRKEFQPAQPCAAGGNCSSCCRGSAKLRYAVRWILLPDDRLAVYSDYRSRESLWPTRISSDTPDRSMPLSRWQPKSRKAKSGWDPERNRRGTNSSSFLSVPCCLAAANGLPVSACSFTQSCRGCLQSKPAGEVIDFVATSDSHTSEAESEKRVQI
jgi:hypothetical protein